ncbi:hypothetical protein [Streptomyces sp. NPDC048577]|uniref:hypothetical protein n=1 Tax=Streptomyces sp. NPDC048577 TaxID=3157209 RepID=UPI00341A0C1F
MPTSPPHDTTLDSIPASGVASFFHEDDHPWLHRPVRDIASRVEGTLTAIVHETSGGRTVRIAHIRPVSGIEWTTAATNIQLAQ